jgi:beta-glucanase (GH16 family)
MMKKLATAAAVALTAVTAIGGTTAAQGAIPVAAAMPVGNLPGWTQNYAQDFTTPAALGQIAAKYDNGMRGYDGFGDTSGHGVYRPDEVLSVSQGNLNFHIHTNAKGEHVTAAPILHDWASQTYGRYAVRFKTANLPGYKIAFLLWPSSDNWNEGEIDWPEGNLGAKMSPASAVKGSLTPQWTMTFDPPKRAYSATDSSAYHVARMDWTPGHVRFYWDDVLVTETTKTAGVPTTPFRWTLQAETSTDGMVPNKSTAGNLMVDWVTSYKDTP